MDFGAILIRMPIFLVQYPILIWRLKMSFISPARIQTVTIYIGNKLDALKEEKTRSINLAKRRM